MEVPVLLFAALSLEATLSGEEQEKKIHRADLPAPIDRLVTYEAKVQDDGMKKDIQVDPDGKPLDHEE